MNAAEKSKIRSLLDKANHASLAGDEETEIQIRKELVDLDPNNPRSLLQYGTTCLMHERIPETIETIDILHGLPSSTQFYRQLKTDFLIDTEAVSNLSESFDDWLAADGKNRADCFQLILRAWQHSGEAVFFEKLKSVCTAPDNSFLEDAVAIFFHIKKPTDINWDHQKLSANPTDLFWFTNFVEALLDHGHIEFALKTAVPFRQSLANAGLGNENLIKALDETISIGQYLLAHRNRPHRLIEEDYLSDLIVSEGRSPGKVAFIFTGMNGRAMIGNRILDFYLAQLGYQTVFLKDSQRYGFGKGVKSIGDTRQDTIAYMKRFCEAQDCHDPLIIGASSGTFGAISHGVPMGARRFSLFGPVTAAGDKSVLMGLGDLRVPAALIRCQRAIPEGERRMQDFIEAARQDLSIKVVFNEYDALDRRFAQTLDSYSGTSLIEVPKAMFHNSLRAALAQGMHNALLG